MSPHMSTHTKIAYITATAPYGPDEEFVIRELTSLASMGVELLIFSRDHGSVVFNPEALCLVSRTDSVRLASPAVIVATLRFAWREPEALAKVLWEVLASSRSARIAAKNLMVVPKALYIAGRLRGEDVSHLHVHWGSTTSTMALIISRVLRNGIPWSMTVHRWDIAENNLLSAKVAAAAFVRCISEQGKREVLSLVGRKHEHKLTVIHMGAGCEMMPYSPGKIANRVFRIVTPAHYHPKKGHKYAIRAAKWLIEHETCSFRWTFYGKGPLRQEIENDVKRNGLEEVVSVESHLPNQQLITQYIEGEVDAVVLPSIVTEDGQYEGIPVCLMEAMACGVPVISTDTGAIPELIKPKCGIVVGEKQPAALGAAISQLMKDEGLRHELGDRGRKVILESFNQESLSLQLLSRYADTSGEEAVCG